MTASNSSTSGLALGGYWLSLFNMGLRALGLIARFGLTLYLAKYLSLPEFGLFGLIVGTISVTPAIAGWGINYFLNREVVGRPKLESGRMIRDRLAVTLVSLIALSVLAAPVLIEFHITPNVNILSLTIALAILESLAFDIYQVLVNIGHPLAANVLLFVRSSAWVFPLAAVGIFFPNFRTLETVLSAWLAGSVCGFLSMIWVLRAWPLHAIVTSKIDYKLTLEIIRKARLVYVSDLGIAAMPFLDRFVVAHFLGLAASGVFTLYWSIANTPYLLVSTGVIQLTFPVLVREFNSGNLSKAQELITKMRVKIFAFAGVLCCATGAGFPYLLSWLGKTALCQHETLLCLLLLAACLRLLSDSLSMELSCRHLDRHWAAINILGGFITLVASVSCTFLFGLVGAALGGIFSQFVLTLIRLAVLHRSLAWRSAPSPSNVHTRKMTAL